MDTTLALDLEFRQRFFTQYWNQRVGGNDNWLHYVNSIVPISSHNLNAIDYLVLKPISSITDEDAIEVAKLVHQIDSGWEVIKRYRPGKDFGSIHVERRGNINDIYHISIQFSTGEVIANHHFLKTDTDDSASYKTNIGKINVTSQKPVPFYAIVDFLRKKKYAVPFDGYSVKELVESGLIKFELDSDD